MLDGQVVVITGGAGLIGREFALSVVESGGIAVIADIDKKGGEYARSTIQGRVPSAQIEVYPLDISSESSIRMLVKIVHNRYGRIDALVNTAYPRNKNYGRHFFDVEYSDFCENVSLNLGGYFLTSQQLALYFRDRGGGNIVNVSSIYGVRAPRFELYQDTSMTMPVEYAAIKSALIHLTKYMAKYFKGMNIRVNSISPGGISDSQPGSFMEAYRRECLNKGMIDPADLKGTLIFLLSRMSYYINGQNIIIDDGFTL